MDNVKDVMEEDRGDEEKCNEEVIELRCIRDSNLEGVVVHPEDFMKILKGSYVFRVFRGGYTYFGVPLDGTVVWTRIKGFYTFKEFCNAVKRFKDVHVLNHSEAKWIEEMDIKSLKELVDNKIIEYGIKRGLIRVKMNEKLLSYRDFVSLIIDTIEGGFDFPSDLKVEFVVPVDVVKTCFERNCETLDECILWARYNLDLDTALVAVHHKYLVEEFAKWRLQQKVLGKSVVLSDAVMIEGNRIKVGNAGSVSLYLLDFEELIRELKDYLKAYMVSDYDSFDEFLLHETTGYMYYNLKELVKLGAVWVKRGHEFVKVCKAEKDGNDYINLTLKDGSSINLAVAIYRKTLHVPDVALYEEYKRGRKWGALLVEKYLRCDWDSFVDFVREGKVRAYYCKAKDVVGNFEIFLKVRKKIGKSELVSLYKALVIDRSIDIEDV